MMMDATLKYTSNKCQSKKWTTNNNGTRNKQALIWEVPLETQKSEVVANNILAQTTKPELAQYVHVTIFSPI